jgi:hypothetical protein
MAISMIDAQNFMDLSQAQSNLLYIRTHQHYWVVAHLVGRVNRCCFLKNNGYQSTTDHNDEVVGVLPV